MSTAVLIDDGLARRNALVLSAAQALYGINVSVIIMLGGIVGQMLAVDKSLSTLPVTTFVLGTALATVPASLFMQRFGRRPGFVIGSLIGATGSLVSALAVVRGDFWLLCLGTHLGGYYQASAQYYRFAATDVASPDYRARAVSWVLAGGLMAALLAPELVTYTQDLLSPYAFAGCFLASSGVALLGTAVVTLVDIPLVPRSAFAGVARARPLREILGQWRLVAAIVAGMVSYGMMNLVMTATPLAMLGCNLTVDDATHAIRWHVVAMYLPSFFTGPLITWIGRGPVMLIGLALLAGCGAVALSGVSIVEFVVAMVLLGAGWNFAYIGATAMVTECHRPEERGKVQAFNDLSIFAFVALCSFLSGKLLTWVGWSGVNLMIFPAVALCAVLIVLLSRTRETGPPQPR